MNHATAPPVNQVECCVLRCRLACWIGCAATAWGRDGGDAATTTSVLPEGRLSLPAWRRLLRGWALLLVAFVAQLLFLTLNWPLIGLGVCIALPPVCS